jgi:hypothetical protein
MEAPDVLPPHCRQSVARMRRRGFAIAAAVAIPQASQQSCGLQRRDAARPALACILFMPLTVSSFARWRGEILVGVIDEAAEAIIDGGHALPDL